MATQVDLLAYLSAFIGALLEGEVALVTSLQASRMGYANFYGILLAGFIGTLLADWFFFLSARLKGRAYLQNKPRIEVQLNKMNHHMDRHANWLLLFYRFIYGFRTALPILFGLSDIPIRKFALFSLISTVLWICYVGTLGHYVADWLGF